MTDEREPAGETVTVMSTRFGELTVPADKVIQVPSGLIGFPKAQRFFMLEHKIPFSWLQCVDDPNLAFVVVDGFEFGDNFNVRPPFGDKDCDFREEDEYAILVVVTVRPDPRMTTANLKAPVFVNLRNLKGVQVIFDDPRFSTRYPLWADDDKPDEPEGSAGK